MHPAIGELVSRVFYGNRVRTGPAAPRRGTGLPVFPSPVTWVDTRSLRGTVESGAGGTSLCNVAEARLVTSITRYLAAQAPPNLTIGVITAYAEQRDLLRRLMGPHDWPPERQLEIDTVDAFEGREKDIIVLSLVRANRRRDIGFLRLEQRLNVAVSRSRRLIIIVGDTSTLRQGYFPNLVATCQQVGQIIPAPKLIGLFLSRGRRPRHERDERRHAGVAEEAAGRELAAAGAEGEALAVPGVALPPGVTLPPEVAAGAEVGAPLVRGVAAEPGVAPAAAPGQESPAPGGARRRRRRAWERRRERLRALREQQQSEQRLDEATESGLGVEPAEPFEAGTADGVGELHIEPEGDVTPRARRPRRRRLPDQAAGAPVEHAPTVGKPDELAAEQPLAPARRRRARRAAEPTGEPIAEPVLESIAPAVPPQLEPVAPAPVPAKAPRVRRKRAVEVVGETEMAAAPGPVAMPPEPEPAVISPKPRGGGRRRAAVEAPSINGIAAMAPGEPSHVDPEPARQTRARRTITESRNGLDGSSPAEVADEIGPPVRTARTRRKPAQAVEPEL